jgi:hypothetical protein
MGFFLFSVLYLYSFVLIVLVFPFVLYCTTDRTQTSMPPAGFEPATQASYWPQNYTLHRTTTGIGQMPFILASARFESCLIRQILS